MSKWHKCWVRTLSWAQIQYAKLDPRCWWQVMTSTNQHASITALCSTWDWCVPVVECANPALHTDEYTALQGFSLDISQNVQLF